MQLHFFRRTTVGDVKKQFAKDFPYLKLDFFCRSHKVFKGSPASQRLADNIRLDQIGTLRREGSLSFSPSVRVTEFESLLQKEFGLPVQVFRKSGSLWLETIQTDNLTLAIQNEMGQMASRPSRVNLHTLFL